MSARDRVSILRVLSYINRNRPGLHQSKTDCWIPIFCPIVGCECVRIICYQLTPGLLTLFIAPPSNIMDNCYKGQWG